MKVLAVPLFFPTFALAIMSIQQQQKYTVGAALAALERYAPLPLQESYDNAGLQVGALSAEVSAALLTLDVTEAVIDEAVACGCNLIVSHHPLIFHKLSQLSERTYTERCVAQAIKHDIAIIAMHTNMDAAHGGVNFKIAEKIGLHSVRLIGDEKEMDGICGGAGVVGTLARSIAAEEFIALLKERFHVACVQTNALLQRPIRNVALCGGAGAFLLDEALRCGADAFVTGEMRYNDFFDHDQEIQIAVIGHYQSEQYTTELFRDILTTLGIPCHITTVMTNPIFYF